MHWKKFNQLETYGCVIFVSLLYSCCCAGGKPPELNIDIKTVFTGTGIPIEG